MKKTFKVERNGKQTWVVVRQMPHDTQYAVGSRIPGLGRVIEIRATEEGPYLPCSYCGSTFHQPPCPYEPVAPQGMKFVIGDRVKAIAYTDCFGKAHDEVRGLIVQSVKHVPEAHGIAAYDRLDCELANLGEALANRHTLPETIRVEAAARFFAFEYSQASELDADGYDAEWHAREAMITENRRREQDRMMLDGGL